MTCFRSTLPRRLTRTLLSLVVGGLAVALPVGTASGADAPASKASRKSGGVTIKGDGLMLEATAAPAILRGQLAQPLSFRVMGGWVNQAKIQRANQETDEAEKRKQARGSFGLLSLQVAAGKIEPGTYQLVPNGKDPKSGTVIIKKAQDAGLASDYTSQSGTLTIQSMTMNTSGSAVAAVQGSFDGQFRGAGGDSRAFSGQFSFVPKQR